MSKKKSSESAVQETMESKATPMPTVAQAAQMSAEEIRDLVDAGDFRFLEVDTGTMNGGAYSEYVVAKISSPYGGEAYSVVIHPQEPTAWGWPVKFLFLDLANVNTKGPLPGLLGRLGPKLLKTGSFSVDDSDGEVRWVVVDINEPGRNQKDRISFVLKMMLASFSEVAKHACRIVMLASCSGHIDSDNIDEMLEGAAGNGGIPETSPESIANHDLV